MPTTPALLQASVRGMVQNCVRGNTAKHPYLACTDLAASTACQTLTVRRGADEFEAWIGVCGHPACKTRDVDGAVLSTLAAGFTTCGAKYGQPCGGRYGP